VKRPHPLRIHVDVGKPTERSDGHVHGWRFESEGGAERALSTLERLQKEG